MKDHILEVKKLIPNHICKKIISYYSTGSQDAQIVAGVNKDIRNCKTTNMLSPSSFGQRIISNYVKSKIHEVVNSYKDRFPYLHIEKISQLDLLTYQSNKHKVGYDMHVDFGTKCENRHLSITIGLNNEFQGGEFVFDLGNEKHQFPQNVGDCIIFPSNFMFPHSVNQVTEGTRYAVIGWVI